MMENYPADNPRHVALILDGNRRFARRLMLEPWKGHEYGRKKVEDLISYAKSFNIIELTLYVLSQENMVSRPAKELEFLYKLFRETFSNMDLDQIMINRIRFRFIGNLDLLPESLRQECRSIEIQTSDNDSMTVNIAIAYSGRQELVSAVKNILLNKVNPADLDESTFEKYLLLESQPDLIIRTGGEKRTSNFLPWQSIYSEWLFLDKMWPEFEESDFSHCIDEYKKRKRNFGQ